MLDLHIRTADDLAAEEQARLRTSVNAERDRRLAAGATVHVEGYGGIPVQGRPNDQVNLIALGDTAGDLAALGVTDPVIPFRDAVNAMHDLTPAQMTELVREAKTQASAIYQASWALKDGTVPADYTDDKYWP